MIVTATLAGPLLGGGLADRVAEIVERPEFAGSTFGIVFRDLESGAPIYELNPQALLPPASTTKLVSCGGALAVLGKDFRWETPLVRTGPVIDGVLQGDLVLVASGDPNLSQRVTGEGRLLFADRDHSYAGFSESALVPGDPLRILREMARKVRESGIVEVQGDVLVDDGLFAEMQDGFVGPFSAVCINDNLVDITIEPGADAGEAPVVRRQPDLSIVEVENAAITGARGSTTDIWVEPIAGVASFEVRGTVAAGSPATLRVGRLAQPALAAAHYLAELLESEGVRLGGSRRQARFGPSVYRTYPVVAKHVSPPLSEAVRVALKVSQNLHATMLPVVVGSVRGERGDRYSGYRAIRRRLEAAGLDCASVVLHSGSGGGRMDRLSADFVADFLRYMARRDDFLEFYDALPVGGVDGTLSGRFRSKALRGLVRAKTGTLVYRGAFNDRWIYLAKSLAGYVDLRQGEDPGRMLVFSIAIANTVCDDRAEGAERLFRAQEDIIEAVVGSLGGVAAAR